MTPNGHIIKLFKLSLKIAFKNEMTNKKLNYYKGETCILSQKFESTLAGTSRPLFHESPNTQFSHSQNKRNSTNHC